MSELAGVMMNELVIAEPVTVQGPALEQTETERAVTTALETFVLKDLAVPKAIDMLGYVPCPAGCDITVSTPDGKTPVWTGVFWFGCMEIQSFTKTKLLSGLEDAFGAATGCGAEDCTVSKLFALQQMEMPAGLPCMEPDCDQVVDPEMNNCPDHTEGYHLIENSANRVR